MARGTARSLSRMAWRNVVKNARHSLGAVLSIVVGFLAFGLFAGYLDDMEVRQGQSFTERYMYGSLVVEKRGASSSEGRLDPLRYRLDENEQRLLDGFLREQGREVENRVRFLTLSGLASTGRAGVMFIALAHDVPEGERMAGSWRWNVVAGKPLHQAPPNAAVLGRGLGALLGCVPDPPQPWVGRDGLPIEAERPMRCSAPRVQLSATTEAGQLNAIEPPVVGLFDAGLKDFDAKAVFLPLPLAQQLLDTKVISMMTVKLAPDVDPAAFARKLVAAGKGAGLELTAQPWVEHPHGDYYRRGMQILGLYRTFVVAIVIAIAGMSVFTTMLKAVGERVREIGALRSLGFRRRQIVGLFAFEGLYLCLAACVAGLVVTLGVTAAINASGVTYKAGIMSEAIPLAVAYVPRAYAFAAAFLCSVAMAAAVLPARRAARMPIPDALGHV